MAAFLARYHMPHMPVSTRRTGDSLEVRQGDLLHRVLDLAQLVEVWLVRVGEGFAGPGEFILVLVGSNSATPLPLEHHAVWTDLLVELETACSYWFFEAWTTIPESMP